MFWARVAGQRAEPTGEAIAGAADRVMLASTTARTSGTDAARSPTDNVLEEDDGTRDMMPHAKQT